MMLLALVLECLPDPILNNLAVDVPGSIEPSTITAPVVTQVSAPAMTTGIASNPSVDLMASINMPVAPSYPEFVAAPTFNSVACSFVPKSPQESAQSTAASVPGGVCLKYS